MLKLTVTNKLQPAIAKFRSRLQDKIITAMGTAVQVVIGRTVSTYMRDAKDEPARRSPLDKGPLRIVTGRLVRSLTGARTGTNQPESIYRIQSGGGDVTVTFGSVVPYAAIHEYGGTIDRLARSVISTRATIPAHTITIPGRPYLGPALNDESDTVVNLFDVEIQELAREVGL